jgi:hypothetical protein
MKGFESEAGKAGISLLEVITISIKKGWTGFDHSWDWGQKEKNQLNGKKVKIEYLDPAERSALHRQGISIEEYFENLNKGQIIDITATQETGNENEQKRI